MKRPRPGDEAALWECVVIVIVLAAIVAVTSLLAWLAYLLFCYRLVIRTSDSASLKHAAVAAKGVPLSRASSHSSDPDQAASPCPPVSCLSQIAGPGRRVSRSRPPA